MALRSEKRDPERSVTFARNWNLVSSILVSSLGTTALIQGRWLSAFILGLLAVMCVSEYLDASGHLQEIRDREKGRVDSGEDSV